MIQSTRSAATLLFARPQAEEGSNAAKLQDIRTLQALRLRERKLLEKQERLEKRAANLQPAG